MLVIIKVVWVHHFDSDIESFDKEKTGILQRRNYLMKKIVTEPQTLINEMSTAIGDQFQGECALYSCSMLAKSLSNILLLYPETKEDSVVQIDSLISIVLSPDVRRIIMYFCFVYETKSIYLCSIYETIPDMDKEQIKQIIGENWKKLG